MPLEWIIGVLTACAPVLVALVGIIPTVISNRKKTQDSIKESNVAMERHIDKVQATLDDHIREDEDSKARGQRYRILRFYDEMCENRKHSESHFEDILDDINDYENYCEHHPNFKNNRGHVAMEHIKVTYAKIKAKGGFLIHDEEETQ
jgi:hypothetical protein